VVIKKEGYDTQTEEFDTHGVTSKSKKERDYYLQRTLLTLKGLIYSDDGKTQELMGGTTLSLYKKNKETGEWELVDQQTPGIGEEYEFQLAPNNHYKVVAEKDGYLVSSQEFDTYDMTESELKLQPFTLKKKKKDLVFRIPNIYYDFGSAALREESFGPLDTLVTLLKDNPEITIEVGAHTDNVGSDPFNLRLSQKRAKSVLEYLTKNGVVQKMLNSKGYGETKPIAPNMNTDGSDNEEGRQQNRRTEFKLLSVGKG
jgi:outer membrane protein OmpA-like peptidoglycan-associated protein